MDRLHAMTVFVAVAEAESFAAAGRKLGLSPPAVTRAVADLEAHLGARLLTRTTRFVRTTDAGARYFEDARRIVHAANEADAAAAGIHARPRGQLAITAPVLFGKRYVVPVIAEYLHAYPDTAVSALFVDRVVNLMEEGLDVGLRIGALPDSSLRALRVGTVRRVICATPTYLMQFGEPKVPTDLANHTIIAATAITAGLEWNFSIAGRRVGVKLNPRLLVNTNDAAIEAACKGLGLTRLLSYQVAKELASGELRTVLTDVDEDPMPIHVIHREGRLGSAKVRAFVELAVATLRADPALQ
jgi:DNA-binding transcriptional LysR family regulator